MKRVGKKLNILPSLKDAFSCDSKVKQKCQAATWRVKRSAKAAKWGV